jgi:hypothetical protein
MYTEFIVVPNEDVKFRIVSVQMSFHNQHVYAARNMQPTVV